MLRQRRAAYRVVPFDEVDDERTREIELGERMEWNAYCVT
jgi:hypothetical protein